MNIKSDLQTKQDAAATKPSAGIRHGDDLSGIICIATAKVTIPATFAANDTFEWIPELPVGAVPIPQLASITLSGDPTDGNFTVHVGDAGDADRYGVSVNLAAGGMVNLVSGGSGVPDGAINPYRFTTPTKIIGTIATATGTKAERTAVLLFPYRMKA